MLNLRDDGGFARLFISLAVAEKIKKAARSRSSALINSQRAVRWEAPEKFHITVRFLGQTRRVMIAAVASAVRNCCEKFSPMSLKTQGVAALIRRRYPQTLAVILDGSDALFDFKDAVDAKLEAAGFEPEKRDFIPHITIGRARKRMKFRGALPQFEIPFTADTVCLMESRLKPEGAFHIELERFTLSGFSRAHFENSASN